VLAKICAMNAAGLRFGLHSLDWQTMPAKTRLCARIGPIAEPDVLMEEAASSHCLTVAAPAQFEEYSLMFRFATPVGRVVSAVVVPLVLCAAAIAQAGSSSTTPAPITPAPSTSNPPDAQQPVAPVQTTPTPGAPSSGIQASSPVARSRSRRVNSNRQARIARNIQDAYSHKWEVAGGGGYLRFHPGDTLLKNNEITFFMSGTRMLNPRWGIVGDVRGAYGQATIPNLLSRNNVFKPNISEYSFTGGVQYRFLGNERYSVSAVGTGGVTLSKFGGDTKGLPSQLLGLWQDSNANPTFILGVNADYNLYNNFAVRLQPTYVGTTFGSTLQNNLGVNAGVVYRFGRQ